MEDAGDAIRDAIRRDAIRLNVFGHGKTAGNPATVVFGDEELSREEMQSLAREQGTPVTVFVRRGDPPRVSFFTPNAELPFCGHGALAAGAALAQEVFASGRSSVEYLVGERRVCVDYEASGIATLRMIGACSVRPEPQPARLLQVLGIDASDLDPTQPCVIASVGSPKWLIALRSVEALGAVKPRFAELAELSAAAGVNGAYVYTLRDVSEGADAMARGFNPLAGVDEDAATGVAAAALAGALAQRGACKVPFVVDQGIELRSLNRIHVWIEGEELRVGGEIRPTPLEIRIRP